MAKILIVEDDKRTNEAIWDMKLFLLMMETRQ